jgi:predicted CoA-binding protein
MKTILIIDWPSIDVPESYARGGYKVIVKGGPGPEDYSGYECVEGVVTIRQLGRAPDTADFVYAYRPFDEVPAIVEFAKSLQAAKLWIHGLSNAQQVEAAALASARGIELIEFRPDDRMV